MSILSKLTVGGVSSIIDSISDVVDKFTLTKEEKLTMKSEMQSKLIALDQELEESYRTELESRAEIIKAEMAQGDKYTKRARPTIIYGGLVMVFFTYVLIPFLAFVSKAEALPDITLPTEFWWAWGTVVSVYGAGRSAEKFGISNTITNIATGSGLSKK